MRPAALRLFSNSLQLQRRDRGRHPRRESAANHCPKSETSQFSTALRHQSGESSDLHSNRRNIGESAECVGGDLDRTLAERSVVEVRCECSKGDELVE